MFTALIVSSLAVGAVADYFYREPFRAFILLREPQAHHHLSRVCEPVHRLTEDISASLLCCTQGCDRTVGKTLLITSSLLVAYYSFWIILLPLLPIEPDHIIRSLFPRNVLLVGLTIPVTLGALFFVSVAAFAAHEMYCASAREQIALTNERKNRP